LFSRLLGVATATRFAIDPYVMAAACVTFFPAVMIATLIGGLGAGLLCVVLSAAVVAVLQMPPVTLLLFVLLTIFSVILITRMRLAVQREQAAQAIGEQRSSAVYPRHGPSRVVAIRSAQRSAHGGYTRFKEIFDVTTDDMPIEDLKKLVHPDDAERFWADREASIDLADPITLARVSDSAPKWRGPLGRGALVHVFRPRPA
jgi:hypothetical protein